MSEPAPPTALPAEIPTLCGARTTLRPLGPDDEASFLAGARASEDLHHPWASPPTAPDAYHALVERRRSGSFLSLGVFAGDGGLAAVFNVSQIFYGAFRNAYLGYYAMRPYAGTGLTSEGLGLTLRLCFEHLGLHRLEANIRPGNTASIRLVERAGFEREGYSKNYLFLDGAWRDHERWAIRAEIFSEGRGSRGVVSHQRTQGARSEER